MKLKSTPKKEKKDDTPNSSIEMNMVNSLGKIFQVELDPRKDIRELLEPINEIQKLQLGTKEG